MATVDISEITDVRLIGLVNKLREEHRLDFIEPFEVDNSHNFDSEVQAGSDESHKVLQVEIHEAYQKLFHAELDAWVTKQGLEMDAFMAAVKRDEKKLQKATAEKLLAFSSYESFVGMMVAHRELMEAEMFYDSLTAHRAP